MQIRLKEAVPADVLDAHKPEPDDGTDLVVTEPPETAAACHDPN